MKTKELFKVIVLFFAFGIVVSSCQNDVDDPISALEDAPIKSLPISRTTDITNGECVIGAIQYCGKKLGQKISKEEIIEYFGDRVEKDKDGKILGISLDSLDWDNALNHWFNATYPLGQNDLIRQVVDGKIACCRILTAPDEAHAIVLEGTVPNGYQFLYYDPVLGTSNNKVRFSGVYDPRIITKK